MPAADIHAAIARLNAPRARVRHLWTILVGAEDICLSVFEASDVEAVVQATARAGFPFDRVVEVTPVLGSPAAISEGVGPGARVRTPPPRPPRGR